MPENLLDKVKLQIGRLIGSAVKKDQDVVGDWKALCNANGVTASDRMLELMAWDLLNSGADLREVGKARKEQGAAEVLQKVDIVGKFGEVIEQLSAKLIDKELQRSNDIESLLNERRQMMRGQADLEARLNRLEATVPPKGYSYERETKADQGADDQDQHSAS